MSGEKYCKLVSYIEENQKKFYRIAYSYVKNPDTAMDIVQDSILKALQKYHTLKNIDAVKTWFYRILVNTCLTYIRKQKNEACLNEISDEAQQYNPENVNELKELINKLPPDLKTIIILRYYEDLKLEDIAKITNLNLSTVKSKLYRTLKMLRVDLEKELQVKRVV